MDEGAQVVEHGLDHVRAAPTELGTLELIVSRPAVDQRTVLKTGVLDLHVPGRIKTGDSVARVPSADGGHTAYRGRP